MRLTTRGPVLAVALALTGVSMIAQPAAAQMVDVCTIPEVPEYPGAQRVTSPMLGMRGGMAHSVAIYATNDSVPQVIDYYRLLLGPQGFADTSGGVAQTMAGPAQISGAGNVLVNSVELSRDGRQYVYIAGTNPGYMIAIGCK